MINETSKKNNLSQLSQIQIRIEVRFHDIVRI
jgi:hypothetical protein